MTGFRYLFCVVLVCLSAFASAEEFSGKVVAVMDGDTLLVIRDGHPVKVRLAGIDAPEKAQPFGMASKKSLAEMVKGKQIQATSSAVDDYGRLIAKVYVGEVNVNHEQVRRGMAWEYSRFHSNRELVALQREAQQARRGLWAGEEAVEPSQWRKQHPAQSQAASPVSAPATASRAACGSKKHCSQMSSCEEARHYLAQCGIKTLDGNDDGVPCEKLCSPKESKAD